MNGKTYVAPRMPDITVKYRAQNSKTTYTVTQLMTGLTWSGSTRSVARSATINMVLGSTDDRNLFTPKVGAQVQLYFNGLEYLRGVVRNVGATADGTATLEVSDYNWYLAQNTVSYIVRKKTASQIIKELALKYGIQVGRIADTKHVFPRLVFFQKTLAEIIQTVIYETYKASKRRFSLENNRGKLELVAVQPQAAQTLAGRGTNLLGADVNTSLDNVRTRVVLTGGNDEYRASKRGLRATQTDNVARAKYGLMTHTEHKDGTNRPATLAAQTSALLKLLNTPETSAEVEIIGDISVRAGKVLWAEDPVTGLTGSFWVTTDTHTFSPNGTYTTRCVLSKTFDMEQITYEEPDTSDPNADKSVIGAQPTAPSVKLNWVTGFEATAYNPALGGINGNGDGLVSTSSKFTLNRSIAVDPKVIPYGSIVYIKSADYPTANGIYLAEDTGGAIKGKRIDIGLAKAECKAFGRRKVQIAILEKGKGPADARAKAAKWATVRRKWDEALKPKPVTSGTVTSGGGVDGVLSADRKKVVDFGRSKVGKLRYKLSGGNPLLSGSNIGDCSDFTQWCFKQIGINTPNYSGDLWAKYPRISASQVQPGDVAVFAGTIPGRGSGVPSHVGLVTKDGMMVNLQSYGCKEESYRNGYWNKYLIGFVRVIKN